jgi:hypothetical protein
MGLEAPDEIPFPKDPKVDGEEEEEALGNGS